MVPNQSPTEEPGRRSGKKRQVVPQPSNAQNNDGLLQKWKYKVSDEEEERKQKKEVSNAVKKEKERERRGRMTDSIEVLRALIPQCRDKKKINQSRVMELAVYHIQSLERKIAEQSDYIQELQGQRATKRQKTSHVAEDINMSSVSSDSVVDFSPGQNSSPSRSTPPTQPTQPTQPLQPIQSTVNPEPVHQPPFSPPPMPLSLEEPEWTRHSRDWGANFPAPTYDDFLPITPSSFDDDAGTIFDTEHIDIEDIAAYKWPFQPFQANAHAMQQPSQAQQQSQAQAQPQQQGGPQVQFTRNPHYQDSYLQAQHQAHQKQQHSLPPHQPQQVLPGQTYSSPMVAHKQPQKRPPSVYSSPPQMQHHQQFGGQGFGAPHPGQQATPMQTASAQPPQPQQQHQAMFYTPPQKAPPSMVPGNGPGVSQQIHPGGPVQQPGQVIPAQKNPSHPPLPKPQPSETQYAPHGGLSFNQEAIDSHRGQFAHAFPYSQPTHQPPQSQTQQPSPLQASSHMIPTPQAHLTQALPTPTHQPSAQVSETPTHVRHSDYHSRAHIPLSYDAQRYNPFVGDVYFAADF